MARPKRSEAERAEWHAKLKELAERVRALSTDEQAAMAAEAGTITAEGRALSPFNSIFLAMQAGRPLAQVGGFRQWQNAGRMVRAGQHAAGYIWVPLTGKKTEPGAQGETEAERTRFRMVPVFDVSQTEPLDDRPSAAEVHAITGRHVSLDR